MLSAERRDGSERVLLRENPVRRHTLCAVEACNELRNGLEEVLFFVDGAFTT